MRAHRHGQQSLLHWFRANAYELDEFAGTPCYITDNTEPRNIPAVAVSRSRSRGRGRGRGDDRERGERHVHVVRVCSARASASAGGAGSV
jgi:hypothetical protein